MKEVGFEPTIESTSRFTIYHLKPLGHSFIGIKRLLNVFHGFLFSLVKILFFRKHRSSFTNFIAFLISLAIFSISAVFFINPR
jgi:hypothetical protein